MFSHFQNLDIQEYVLKGIFQNFIYFMSYSQFCEASAQIRPEQMNNKTVDDTRVPTYEYPHKIFIVFYPFLMYF